jgi:hypothetical protein
MFRKICLFDPKKGTWPEASRNVSAKVASYGECFANSACLAQKRAPRPKHSELFVQKPPLLANVSENLFFGPKRGTWPEASQFLGQKSLLLANVSRHLPFWPKKRTSPQAFRNVRANVSSFGECFAESAFLTQTRMFVS